MDSVISEFGPIMLEAGWSHGKITFWSTVLFQNSGQSPNISEERSPHFGSPQDGFGNDILRAVQTYRRTNKQMDRQIGMPLSKTYVILYGNFYFYFWKTYIVYCPVIAIFLFIYLFTAFYLCERTCTVVNFVLKTISPL